MMAKLVECVPNISEGRRKEIVDQVVGELSSFKVRLLDVESDPDHNRTVITYVGEPSQVKDATLALAKKAVELINMEEHKGEHPRMGAIDVVPFIPIKDIEMDECVEIAREVGRRFYEELGVPTYLYEKAATRPERENLAKVRKGQYEGLKGSVKEEGRHPDFGKPELHPTAGITAVGAREPLVAFNVNLGTNDLEIAKNIAMAVRHLNGGLRYVKAMGFDLKERGIVQVSMNLVNYKGTPIFRVFEMIKNEADRYGVPVIGSEVIGLVPLDALIDCADHYLKIEKFNKDQILENRLWSDG